MVIEYHVRFLCSSIFVTVKCSYIFLSIFFSIYINMTPRCHHNQNRFMSPFLKQIITIIVDATTTGGIIMAELLITDESNIIYFLLTNDGEVLLSKLCFDMSGFVSYDEVKNHSLTSKDVHNLIHHGSSKNYKVFKNLKNEKLPSHILMDEDLYEYISNRNI